MYIHPIPFAIIVFFALVGSYTSIRYLLDWKSDSEKQHEKYKRFYQGSPKAMRKMLDDTENFYN